MQNDSYGKHIKKVLKKLKVACNKLLHFDWKLDSKIFDLLGEDSEEIHQMGNWSNSVWDNYYSNKLPLPSIQKLVGYCTNNKFYFNTKTVQEPLQEVLLDTLLENGSTVLMMLRLCMLMRLAVNTKLA